MQVKYQQIKPSKKLKAKIEYDKYRNIIDIQPTQVDKDLADALQRLEKNLNSNNKKDEG